MDYGMDVLGDMFGHVPAQTQCEYCGKVVPLADVIRTTVQLGDEILAEEHYCSHTCGTAAFSKRTGVDA